MTASQMIRQALQSAVKTQTALAEHMGWSKQNLSVRLKNNSLTHDELVKALAFCGYSVKMVNDRGESIPNIGNSKSPKVVQMVEGITYDTSKAESICVCHGTETGPLYTELFRDMNGRYFLVYYQNCEGGKNMVAPLSSQVAKMFVEKYR